MNAKSWSEKSRREFLAGAGSFAVAVAAGGPARAAMGPNDKFDLVIKGGDVLDPSQIAARQARHRHPLRRDRGGRGRHSGRRARCSVLDASGKLVTPGLIDLHCPRLSLRLGDRHSRRRAGAVPGAPPRWCRRAMPAPTISPRFRRYIVAQTRTRLYAFVHIANIGPRRRSRSPSSTTSITRRSTPAPWRVAENADFVLGVKVRMSRERDRQARPRAAEARDQGLRDVRPAGQGDVHIGGVETPGADVADPRPAAAGRRADPRLFRRAQHRRRLHQHRAGRQAAAGGARRQAARRDVRRRPWRRQLRLHGGGGGDRRRAAAPDTISSDIHVFSGNTPGMPYLPWVMSKFMQLGFTLEQVVAMATISAGQGHQPRAEARHAAGRRARRRRDPGTGGRAGRRSSTPATTSARARLYLKPVQTVIAGVPFGRPYQAPFAVR